MFKKELVAASTDDQTKLLPREPMMVMLFGDKLQAEQAARETAKVHHQVDRGKTN